MELPEDLRAVSLKYSGRCRSCAANLEVGERAYWSRSTKMVLCVDCTGDGSTSVRVAPGRAAKESGRAGVRADAKFVEAPVSSSNSSQSFWQQLCAYARRSIEAEAAKSLVPHAKVDALWFFHQGEEELVAGQSDSTPATGKLANVLNSRTGLRDRRSIIYGWPTVVVIDRDRIPKVAPLFLTQVEPERGPDSEWRLHATVEPEFNLAITAGGIFDPSIAEEIGDLLGHGLPFGNADALADVARQTADLLGLDIRSPLDPGALDMHVGPQQGVYNAAVSVLTELSAHSAALLEELRQLQTRNDWASTGAAHLVPGGFAPAKDRRLPSGSLAAPLACNLSQEETLNRLRSEPLTIVTGPPGTGKTQLVVNAVTNAWLDGDKVLVTSTNNAAVDVAVDRATTDISCGLLMRTGNRTVREQVPGRITAASAQAKAHAGNQAEARAQLQRTAVDRARLTEKLARLDELEANLLLVAQKLEEAREASNEAAQALWASGRKPGLPIDPLHIERRASGLLRAWFFRGFRARRLRKRLGCIETATLEQLVKWARRDQHQAELTRQLESIRAECRNLKNAVGDPAESMRSVDRNWAQASLCAIRAETSTRIRSGADRLAAFGRASSGGGPFKRAVGLSLDNLRGWACTALSASPNFPLEPCLFDLVIVDEASQCSLAAVLPLAYRAKRLAVVGDPCQLHPIVSLGDRLLQEIAAETEFDNDDLRRRGIHHKDGSAYFAFEFAAGPDAPTLLDEHYRCHPHIARWFNRTFYNDRLSVLTEVADTAGRHRTVSWQDVEGEAQRPSTGRSWLNRAEAKQAVIQLGDLVASNFTVGVVTPFAAQAQLIERLAEERFGRSALDEADFVCGTAHRLQGDERDAIVISAVLSPEMPKTGARWVERERTLLNVAVSRARMGLIVLGHPAVGALGSPTLSSLRAYLRDEVAGNVGSTQLVADFRTDSRSEELLLSAMQLRNLVPYAKLNVEGYELDFALMERGIKLDVEVDGDQHLDSRGRQRRQDLTRDRVLSNLGWTVLRIPAWRCHEEIDEVIAEIERMRDRLLDEPVSCRSS